MPMAYGKAFSDWSSLAQQIRKGFDYGKQRCTAYVRYVIQRQLFPQFLEMYLPVLRSLQYGNPVLVERDEDPLPKLDFGPLINSKKVEELRVLYTEALGKGRGQLIQKERSPTIACSPIRISVHSCCCRRRC